MAARAPVLLAWPLLASLLAPGCSRNATDPLNAGVHIVGPNAGTGVVGTPPAIGAAGSANAPRPAGTTGSSGGAGTRAAPATTTMPGATDAPDQPGTRGPIAVTPTSRNEAELPGDWWLAAGTEQCPALRRWYTFTPDGQVVHRVVDHGGGCPAAEIESKGTFWHGRGELQIMLALDEEVSPRDPRLVGSGIGQESMEIAIVRGAAPEAPDTVHLDRSALLSRDARHFSAVHRLLINGVGPQGSDLRVEVNLEVDRSLRGVQPGDELVAHVLARVITVDVGGAAPVTHEVELDYIAVVERDRGWLRLVASELVGLDDDASERAWQGMLRAAGAGAYPEAVRAQYDQRIHPAQRFAPNLPTTLISAHVARTGLTRAR